MMADSRRSGRVVIMTASSRSKTHLGFIFGLARSFQVLGQIATTPGLAASAIFSGEAYSKVDLERVPKADPKFSNTAAEVSIDWKVDARAFMKRKVGLDGRLALKESP
jgi:hypothetical protein